MGSELVRRCWCDNCSNVLDDITEVRLTISGHLDRVVDLCDLCFKQTLGAVVEAFADLGQAADRVELPKQRASAATLVDPAVKARRRRSSSPPPDDPPPGTASWVDPRCRICPHVGTGANAMWQHAAHKHNLGRDAYRATPVRPDSALGRGVEL